MPDRPMDTSLLKAVELLMGQFSEQILALLEAHARGDLAGDAFEARIRELVGAVSPAAVARHPGRLTLARPAPPAPDLPPAPEPVAFEPEPVAAEPEPAAVASESPPVEPEPPAIAPEPAGPAILDGESGFEPLPEFELEAVSEELVVAAVPEPGEALPAAASDLPEPAAAPPPLAPAPFLLWDGVADVDLLPLLDVDLPAEEPAAPAPARDLPPAPEPVAVEPEPSAVAPEHAPPAPAGPAILDGVSGFEPLPEFELEVFSEAPAASVPAAEPPRSAPAGEGPAAPPPPSPAPPRPGKAPARNAASPAASPAPGSRSPAPAPAASAAPAPAPGEAKAPSTPPAGPPVPATAPGKPLRPAAPPDPPRTPGRRGVVVSGRMTEDDLAPAGRAATGFGEGMFGDRNGGAPAVSPETSFVSRQVRREIKDKGTWRSPGKASLLSLLLPGVGDFYLGKLSTGLVFYLVFYVLLVLCILRGDLMLVPVLAALALASCLTSWLGAHKHNDIIHRMQDTPSLGRKTRETNFSFDHSRRRR